MAEIAAGSTQSRMTPSGHAALNDGGYILAVRIDKFWVLPIAG
jgi:hypothetical protein